MVYKIRHSIYMVIVALVTFSAVAALEHDTTAQIKKTQMRMAVAKAMQGPLSSSAAAERETAKQELSILQNNVHMIWMGCGSVIGGFCIVGFRKLEKLTAAARYFGVSAGCSIGAGPFIIHHISWVNPQHSHDCLFVGFVVSLFAWAAFAIVEAAFIYVKRSVEQNGIQGLKDALLTLLSLGMLGKHTGGIVNVLKQEIPQQIVSVTEPLTPQGTVRPRPPSKLPATVPANKEPCP